MAKKECKNKQKWVGNVVNWELCKRLKFDHPDKPTPDNVLENTTLKILWDFFF